MRLVSVAVMLLASCAADTEPPPGPPEWTCTTGDDVCPEGAILLCVWDECWPGDHDCMMCPGEADDAECGPDLDTRAYFACARY